MKRVFVGMTEVAGFYFNLSHGLRTKGYSVSEFYFDDHKFSYGPPQNYSLLFKIIRKNKYYLNRYNSFIINLIDKFLLCLFLIHILVKYDIFIFGFGSSIFRNNKDLKILKFFGKTIISNIAHGSEARPPYINGAKRKSDGSYLSEKELIDLTAAIKGKVRYIEDNSTFVIGAPFSSQFLKYKFINLFNIGLPYQVPRFYKNEDVKSNTTVRILHSPSNPVVKGTDVIREVINKLKKKGYKIEYIEIINKPNEEVIKELIHCDFVIDQVYSDTPLAGFATEAAFYGKPAIVGGYGWDLLMKILSNDIFPPSEICHPESLEASVIKLIEDINFRLNLGKKALSFVSSNWTSEIIAEKFIKIFNNNVDETWLLNPNDIVYINGIGVPEIDLKLLVQKIIYKYDIDKLGLQEKPNLENAFQLLKES